MGRWCHSGVGRKSQLNNYIVRSYRSVIVLIGRGVTMGVGRGS